jgi:site-specific DNA recombinase
MSTDLFEKIRRENLTGMNFIVLARMSNESKRRKHKKARAEGTGPWYLTGLDIDTREYQVTRCVRYIEERGGHVVDVYEEPHTSAFKKK